MKCVRFFFPLHHLLRTVNIIHGISSYSFTSFIVAISFRAQKHSPAKRLQSFQKRHRWCPTLVIASVMMPFLFLYLTLITDATKKQYVSLFSWRWPQTALHTLVRFSFLLLLLSFGSFSESSFDWRNLSHITRPQHIRCSLDPPVPVRVHMVKE